MSTIVTVSGKGSPLTHTEFDANFTNLNTDKLDDAVSNGSQYLRKNGGWNTAFANGNAVTSSSKPSSAADGDAWFSESNGVTYVYDSASGDWIALGSSNTSGISSLAAASDTGISSIANGDVLNYSSTDSAFKNAQQHIPSSSYVTPATVYKLTQYNGTNTNWVTLTSWSPSVSGGYFTLDSGYWIVEASMTLDQTNNDINGIFARLVGPSGTARAPASLGDTQISRGPESTILITLLTSVSSTASYHFQVYFGLVTGGGGTRNTGTFDASISFIKVGDV